jgi:hypothetical protein
MTYFQGECSYRHTEEEDDEDDEEEEQEEEEQEKEKEEEEEKGEDYIQCRARVCSQTPPYHGQLPRGAGDRAHAAQRCHPLGESAVELLVLVRGAERHGVQAQRRQPRLEAVAQVDIESEVRKQLITSELQALKQNWSKQGQLGSTCTAAPGLRDA